MQDDMPSGNWRASLPRCRLQWSNSEWARSTRPGRAALGQTGDALLALTTCLMMVVMTHAAAAAVAAASKHINTNNLRFIINSTLLAETTQFYL